MDFRILSLPEKWVEGVALRTTNEKAATTIPQHWEAFFKTFPQISNKKSSDIIALYCDYAGDHTQPYTLIIGHEVQSTASNVTAKYVPASTYAVFTVNDRTQVAAAWHHIWRTPIQRTYTGDFELYRNDTSQVEIFVAIARQPKSLV